MKTMRFKANERDKSFESDYAQMNQHFSNTRRVKLCVQPQMKASSPLIKLLKTFGDSLLKHPYAIMPWKSMIIVLNH